MSNPLLIVDISDTGVQGVYADVSGTTPANASELFRDQNLVRDIQLFERDGDGLLAPVDITDAELHWAVGLKDTPPTGGTWGLSYNGDSTGLTALAWDITDANLQTALNANPAVHADGDVTVTKTGLAFFVRFTTTGAKQLFEAAPEGLTPESAIFVGKRPEGTSTVHEVQVIQLSRAPYGETEPTGFVNTAAGEVEVSVAQEGSAGTKASYNVDFSSAPIGGAVQLEWETQASWKLTVTKSNTYVPEIRALAFPTGGAVEDFGGQYMDIFLVDGTVRRVWWNLDGGSTEPAHPTGITNIEVAFATGDNLGTLIQATVDAMAADTTAFDHVTNSLTTPSGIEVPGGWRIGLIYELADAGAVGQPNFWSTEIQSSTTAGETGLGVQPGTDGIGGAVVKLTNPYGKVAFYATSGTTTEPVVSIEDCYDFRAIDVPEDETSDNIADLFQTSIEAHGAFGATRTGNVVTIDPDDTGDFAAPAVTGIGFLFATTEQLGHSISVSVPYNATASDIQTLVGGELTAVVASARRWILTAATTGPQGDIDVDGGSLRWAGVFSGGLNLKRLATEQAFAATTADVIEAVEEMRLTRPGQEPAIVLQRQVFLHRNLIRDGATPAVPSFAALLSGISILKNVTGYTGGGATNLDGVPTIGLVPPIWVQIDHAADGIRTFKLEAGTTAESSPAVIRPDDYNGSTNAKIWILRS